MPKTQRGWNKVFLMKIFLKEITDRFADEVNSLDGYEFANFWVEEIYGSGAPDDGYQRFLAINEDEEQVALVELDLAAKREGFQTNHLLPLTGAPVLEIQFIDVREKFRGQGVGKSVISELEKMFPGRKLMALSEDADGFWRSLGWEEIPIGGERDLIRPLFIAR